ncbi:MAG: DUF2071 domain-containing protein [Aridibacter famidurans]|nr:DUF2071 domain-containing protein [Aridibacter famidurans]
MRIPVIKGTIDRRILTNFHIDPDVMSRNLPAPFRPKIVRGKAIGGICLIRLKGIRPKIFLFPWGIGSENAAHRIAVEWEQDGETKEGVFVPRRDTDSRLNVYSGGTLFPGIHHLADFEVEENERRFSVTMKSADADAKVHVDGVVTAELPQSSVFQSVEEASEFFERGSVGYSATNKRSRFDGLELKCSSWSVSPLEVESVESSYFEDEVRFPKGSVEFDCALLMRDIEHEWHGLDDLCC